MASAINVLDDIHGGAGQQCMELYREIDAAAGPDGDLVAAASAIIQRQRDAGEKIVPGFGHRFHPVDPRTAPLFALRRQGAGRGHRSRDGLPRSGTPSKPRSRQSRSGTSR